MKKETKKITKKKWMFYLIITILLGGSAYMLGSTVTKKVMEEIKKEKKEEVAPSFGNLTNIETIEEKKLDEILANYNKEIKEVSLSSYSIEKEDLEKKDTGYETTKEEISFFFQTEEEGLKIAVIKYKEEREETKKIIKALMKANNPNLTEEEADLLYDSVIKTRETTKEEDSSTSEFFQYKGLEASEKIITKEEKEYQFRIGRITEK